MKYEQTTIQKIEFSPEDILLWVRHNAAKQLGVTPDEITDEMIQANANLANSSITVTFTKTTSN